MKLIDLFSGSQQEITLQIKPAIQSEAFQITKLTDIKITYSSSRYWLVYPDATRVEITGVGPRDNAELDLVCTEQSIVFVFEKHLKKLILKVRLFNDKITMPEIMEIGFGDDVEEVIEKRYYRQLKNNDKVTWLETQLFVDSNTSRYALISHSPKENGFQIYGQNIHADVIKSNDKLEITRIVTKRPNQIPTILLEADLHIRDTMSTQALRQEASLALDQIDTNERYLSTWKKYQELERKLTDKKQRKIGLLKIKKIVQKGSKYKLIYKEDKNNIEWLNNVFQDDFIELHQTSDFGQGKVRARIIDIKDGYILVDLNDNLMGNNVNYRYAAWSTIGDDILQRRRDKALELLKHNMAPMPQLSAILEGIATSSRQTEKITALTPTVKQEFGEKGPNTMQEEALRIALNTPDIAIIQGPPGTGKTKVIGALSKRLALDAQEKNIDYEKQILLTAFQHDAVDNMVDRTNVMGLPAIKFGKKNSQIDTIGKWIIETTKKIEAEQLNLEPNKAEKTYEALKKHYLKYIETKNGENALEYLQHFQEKNILTIPAEIASEIVQSTFGDDTHSDTKQILIQFVKNLISDAERFSEDGVFNLKRFIRKYKFFRMEESIPALSADDLMFLENLSREEIPASSDLDRLEEVKINYLDQLVSTPATGEEKTEIEIENIFLTLLDHYSREIKRDGSVYSVLSEYIYDLSSRGEGVYRAVESYSALLASTIQGSQSKDLLESKSDPFDTVIVDEAARANPLDLIIPMTTAKRRIVLVGDHRQLPHIVDEEIQNEISKVEDIAQEYLSHLKDSLFERLLKNAKKLEEEDGIKRVITLDTQYRMHPVLGDFISRTFYEKMGDPKIKSSKSADQSQHFLSHYQGKVAVSIDIPDHAGAEKRYGSSLCRPKESRESIRIAKEILDENPSLSVGIITFYRGQADELYREAEKESLVEKDTNNKFQIAKNYAITQAKEERLRIGTVDAFQGKEFDVVILSLVRSNSKRNFGFLTSYNRLNVAMSRAKKLLIAVGNEQMFRGEDAKKSVYGLYAFYNELIGSEYGTSIRS